MSKDTVGTKRTPSEAYIKECEKRLLANLDALGGVATRRNLYASTRGWGAAISTAFARLRETGRVRYVGDHTWQLVESPPE